MIVVQLKHSICFEVKSNIGAVIGEGSLRALFVQPVTDELFPSLQILLNQQQELKLNEAQSLGLSHRCSPSGHCLPVSMVCSRLPHRQDLSSSQHVSQTSSGVIACQSCLRACFSSRRHAPDKKHIFTHKNEITGNLRAGAAEATPAIELYESMNSQPWLLYQLAKKMEKTQREEKKKKCLGNVGLTGCQSCHFFMLYILQCLFSLLLFHGYLFLKRSFQIIQIIIIRAYHNNPVGVNE